MGGVWDDSTSFGLELQCGFLNSQTVVQLLMTGIWAASLKWGNVQPPREPVLLQPCAGHPIPTLRRGSARWSKRENNAFLYCSTFIKLAFKSGQHRINSSEFMCIPVLNYTRFSFWWTFRCGLKIFSISLPCLSLVSESFSVSFFSLCSPLLVTSEHLLWTTCAISCTLPRFTRIVSFPLTFKLGIKYTVNGSTGKGLYLMCNMKKITKTVWTANKGNSLKSGYSSQDLIK